MPKHDRRHSAVSCAKIGLAQQLEMPFGLGTRLGQGSICYLGLHSRATWRIQLNRSCSSGLSEAAAMGPYVKLL